MDGFKWYNGSAMGKSAKLSNPRRIQDAILGPKSKTTPRMNLGKYKSFGSYSKGVFRYSLITSFPEIATARSHAKRLVKVLVFVACVVGFTYQTLNFLHMYLAYPTVVNVHITNPLMVDQPGITVCNLNRRRRTYICMLEGNECNDVIAPVFCRLHIMQCPGNIPAKAFTKMPYLNDVIESEFYWEYSELEAHNDSMFKDCFKHIDGKLTLNCTKPYMPVPVIHANGEPNYCYTVESQYGQPDSTPNRYANFFVLELNLYTQPEEYIVSTAPIRLQISLHDRKSRINPFFEGYTLSGGVQYLAYVSMVSKERLPYPYDTNCTDYLKLWRENNGTGPLNEIMCVEQCKLNKLLEKDLCIDKTVNYPHEQQLCTKNTILMTGDMLEECYAECGYACSDSTYEVAFQEIENYDHICGLNDVWCKHHITRINFNFLKFRHTTYIYQPKFESVEMFSYVGGYMGMWLGLSLISLFDLFETLCFLMFFPIGRALHRRRKMNRLETTKQYGNNFYNNLTVVY